MFRKYAVSLAVVVVFVVLLAVVLLTQPKSDNSTSTAPAGAAAGATSTPNADAAKLQVIHLSTDDTITKLTISELAPASAVLTTATTPATTAPVQTDTASAVITSTPTPFVGATPGQPRKLALEFLPNPANTWKVAGSTNFPLDSGTVASSVQQLSDLSAVAALPADASNNLAQYGLDQPRLTIMLQSTKGGSKTLDVGSLNGVTQNYWVKLEGGTQVWTVAASTIDTFKGWLNTPPVLPPTPTAEPTTAASGTPGASTTSTAASGTTTSTASGTTTTAATTTPPATTTAASSTTPVDTATATTK